MGICKNCGKTTYLTHWHACEMETEKEKEWQGLSEQEINIIQGGFCKGQYFVPDLIKAIEQKLKEKNT